MATTEASVRQAAKTKVEDAVNAEALDIFQTLRSKMDSLGIKEARLTVGRWGGPEIVITDTELTPLALAQIFEIVDQRSETGSAVELHEGQIRIASSSWPPDRIPF
jgi:hypothetical protein